MPCRKRNRKSPEIAGKCDLFDALPDDLVISILCKLSSSAGCPSDFINVLITYVTLRLLLSSCLIFIRRQQWGKKSTPSPELDLRPSDLSAMSAPEIQAEMMKRHSGPAFGGERK
ncbi:hypothetical protein FH972_015721 [Carpinus fangiana]|uniref:F-box domain-containing protein n=1 Tax=Carpinus fangiana TaxID=176857 RepID=A0A5N6RET2_9ROSI|nr:hypothetical protein FH972_015721 [Carpinus fangiana]